VSLHILLALAETWFCNVLSNGFMSSCDGANNYSEYAYVCVVMVQTITVSMRRFVLLCCKHNCNEYALVHVVMLQRITVSVSGCVL
jgi:hypothetical protein